MKPKQAILILSGYNIRAVIAFSRWAAEHHVNFHIITRGNDDPIILTKYKDRVVFTRSTDNLVLAEFCSWIREICDQYGYDRVMVLPSSEYLNRFLLDHREMLETEGCIVPLVDNHLYTSLSDKLDFSKLCESFGLDIPTEFPEMPASLPFVAKPRTYCSSDGRQLIPHLLISQQDLDRFCRDEDVGEYFFQTFVFGENHYLLAYVGKTEEDILFSQENLMQQARGGSIILARPSDFHQTQLAQLYIKMLRNIDFSGLIMIEIRFDKSSGRYFMIEANPRLWGPLQFAIDNDVDFFGALLRDYGFEVKESSSAPRRTNFYFWSGGVTQMSQPATYHNYSNEQFVKDFPELQKQDVFDRCDTHELFMMESKMEKVDEIKSVD